MGINKLWEHGFLPIYLAVFQIIFIIFLGVFAEYDTSASNKEVPGLYSMFMDVHTMMFIGFGFLMTFLKKYGYSSVGYNFLLAAYVLQWALLVRGWIHSIEEGSTTFKINIENLLVADFCSAAVLISFGAVLGKATMIQLIFMATFEVVIQGINEHIGLEIFKAYDVGESIYVHTFGAYFGLTVAKVLNKTVKNEKEEAIYHSDLFAMIGTIFLWLYWPSFNSAVAVEEGQLRAIINTYISITASCITTFIISSIVGKGKLNMVHIQNSTLAGGVAIGAIADMNIKPFSAALIGSLTGVISTLGYEYLNEFLNHKLRLHDTCGVNNLHGMPGLISGISSIIAAFAASRNSYNGDRLYVFYPSRIPKFDSPDYFKYNLNNSTIAEFKAGGDGRSASTQAGYQLAALVLTLGMAIIGGLLTGLFLKSPIFKQMEDSDLFDDEKNWKLPEFFSSDEKKTDVLEAVQTNSINLELKTE